MYSGDVVVAELTRAAEAEGAALHLVTDPERLARLGQVLGEAESHPLPDARLHRGHGERFVGQGAIGWTWSSTSTTLGLGPAAGLCMLVVKAEMMDVPRTSGGACSTT